MQEKMKAYSNTFQRV